MTTADWRFLRKKENWRRLAGWLRLHTRLTDEQIRHWADLDADAYDAVLWAGDAADQVSPINKGMLGWPEIRRCEASPDARLEKRAEMFHPKLRDITARADLSGAGFHVARRAAVYVLYDGRNAWHSTWSKRYWVDAISTSWESAVGRAEHYRRRGSVFYVHRIPAIALQSDRWSFVGFEVNDRNELGAFSEVFDGPLSIRRVWRAYQAARRHTVLWREAEGNVRFEGWRHDRPAVWTSVPFGSDQDLLWNKRAGDRDITPDIRDIVRRANRSIRRYAVEAEHDVD